MGRLSQIDAALSIKDISTAQSANSFAAANNIEAKQQQVNSVKIKLNDTTNTML